MNSTVTAKHFQLFLSNPNQFNAKIKMYHVVPVPLINNMARTSEHNLMWRENICLTKDDHSTLPTLVFSVYPSLTYVNEPDALYGSPRMTTLLSCRYVSQAQLG
jgi:hypothetical protein